VRVDWRLTDQVRHTFDRTIAIVAAELRKNGVAAVDLDPPILGGEWPDTLEKEGTWHHMGTTRMHESPTMGVVDPDCKMHGVDNLYVAGSSVFPTAGANFPTITIAALALRLSEHLAARLRRTGGATDRAGTQAGDSDLLVAARTVFNAPSLGRGGMQ
jgi:choline dehydrogenase-like flavoprotein